MSMSILTHARRLGIGYVLPILVLTTGCAYRFTNTAIRSPLGIQTLAVEAVWDNSRDVIPHELLWSSMQREVIRNGRVTLTNQSEADALMVVSITKAKVSPVGTSTPTDANSKDPPESTADKATPDQYRNLRRAGNYTTDEGITMNVHVNVYDLKSRALLFNRDYATGITFKSNRGESVTPVASAYLQYEEALQARFRAASDSLAHSIVNDFLM
ncbi:MAG: hypothetical protein H7249_17275 [Chitinophagaceae bacterium]|nr:hypothetical protein [Oligoflexus sp.]